jgi:tetratricopeptide (TPR) repeat protein
VLRRDADNLQARDLLVLVLRALDRRDEADALLDETLELDPLDQWARHLAGRVLSDDAPTLLDVALEYGSAGWLDEALSVLDLAQAQLARAAQGQVNVGPLLGYHRASLLARAGRAAEARRALVAVHAVDATRCLPSRLDDVAVLVEAVQVVPADGLAWSLLGSWFYAHGRGADAADAWRRALEGDLDDAQAAVVERNLGIAAYNVEHDPELAATHFEAARRRRPDDSRLLFEADQLAERRGTAPADRLRALELRPDLVDERDDLSVVRARLLTLVGRHHEALAAVAARRFQPWEGGEGQVLGVWEAAQLAAATEALSAGDPARARTHVESALEPPRTLGEARHPLQTTAELHLALGDALASLGDDDGARGAWHEAAAATGDFAGMATQAFTERSAAAVTALSRLGADDEARALLAQFDAFVDELATTPAEVDYFATSLPTMLLFQDDPQDVRDAEVQRLRSVVRELGTELARGSSPVPPVSSVSTPDPTAPAVTTGDDAGRR